MDWKRVLKRYTYRTGKKQTTSFLKDRYKQIRPSYSAYHKYLKKEDDEKILNLIDIHGKDWLKIAEIFGGNMDPLKLKNHYFAKIVPR
mmetsp:Transcript_140399/g.199032  ORF Transcript_140399/g.199032 Transcript_140399/m.199032 type:complete len:88 (-) Transcript_140399:150-413(-)